MRKTLSRLTSAAVAALGFLSLAQAEVRIVNNLPGSYVDIFAVGTRVDLGDDGETTITTSIGNSLLPAGQITLGNNGSVVWVPGTFVDFTNAGLPSTALGNGAQALAPFWDDLFTANASQGVYYAEIDGTLYVTWFLTHFDDRDEPILVQLQVHSEGLIPAQFVYVDTGFGNGGLDNGVSATIGYQAGGVRNDAQWSFNTVTVGPGTVLSIIDRNAANVSIVDNVPGKYVDVSSVSTYINLGDDGQTDFITNIGNAVLPAGLINISNNGAVSWGQSGVVAFTNGGIPSGNLGGGGQSLAVYWDDLFTYARGANERPDGVYVAERAGVLYITWRLGHFEAGGNGLVQLQVFSSGPVYAQYVYRDVDFANANFSNGASATVGYQSGGSGSNVQWSFNEAGAITPDLVLSIVEPTTGSNTCPADFNNDGFVNPDDLTDFITGFFLTVQFGCP
jgi:hypothetical protein